MRDGWKFSGLGQSGNVSIEKEVEAKNEGKWHLKYLMAASLRSGLMYVAADIKAKGEKKESFPLRPLKNSAAYLRVSRVSAGIIPRARLSGRERACRRPRQSLAERGGVQRAIK